MKLEIVCAGVGGRGVLLASTIIIETAIKADTGPWRRMNTA